MEKRGGHLNKYFVQTIPNHFFLFGSDYHIKINYLSNKGVSWMSLETIKKLIWASNVFFFGSKKITKYDFIFFYGFFATLFVAFVFWVVTLKII